jgi:hypothetical protein
LAAAMQGKSLEICENIALTVLKRRLLCATAGNRDSYGMCPQITQISQIIFKSLSLLFFNP